MLPNESPIQLINILTLSLLVLQHPMLTRDWKASENLYAACLSKDGGLRVGTSLFGRAVGGERPYSMAGFSGGGGHMQKSWRIRTRRSIPPSIVMISRILGEVDVRYTSCVSELKSGNGEVVPTLNPTYVSNQGVIDAVEHVPMPHVCSLEPRVSRLIPLSSYIGVPCVMVVERTERVR